MLCSAILKVLEGCCGDGVDDGMMKLFGGEIRETRFLFSLRVFLTSEILYNSQQCFLSYEAVKTDILE